MAAFSRFTSAKKLEEIHGSDTTKAWIEYRPSSMAHSNARSYSTASMYLGNNLFPVEIKLVVNDSTWQTDTMEATANIIRKTWNLGVTPKKLRFEFRGVDSPDVDAIRLKMFPLLPRNARLSICTPPALSKFTA